MSIRKIYAYVGDNPLRWVDPLGLEAGVTVWQPVGWGESSFGHVSADVNGTTFSFGPGGMTILPTTDYVQKNDFRSGIQSQLNLTPKQEAQFKSCLSQPQPKYSPVSNNCGTPVQACLKQVGIDTGNVLFPVSLGNKLLDLGVVDGITEYSPTKPATGTSAPWAR